MSEPVKKRDHGTPESGAPSRRESGLRRKLDSSTREAWPAMVDQDSVPTQPENEAPEAPKLPAPPVDKPIPTVDMPPASFEDLRDTIPSPPPDREHD